MEFLIAIAMLCQVGYGGISIEHPMQKQLQCQQSYIHCVNVKTSMTKQDALERCILEKK